MKNTLFFSYIVLSGTCYGSLNAQNQDSVVEELACSIDFDSILSDGMLDAISDQIHPSTLRNARAVKKHESMVQKLQNMAISCYAHILCRYYRLRKWLIAAKQQQAAPRA